MADLAVNMDDPYTWTVERVQRFFREEAQSFADMPNIALPDTIPFLEQLAVNDVSGAVLLIAMNATFLKDECQVKSLGKREAVTHCIQKLRTFSASLNSRPVSPLAQAQAPAALLTYPRPACTRQVLLQNRESDPQEVTPSNDNLQGRADLMHHLLPVPDQDDSYQDLGPELEPAHRMPSQLAASELEESELPLAFPKRDKIRPGEALVENAGGRKRRKLNLAPAETASARTSESHSATEVDLLKPWPVDELFFGETGMGEELGTLKPRLPVTVLPADGDPDDTYQFHGLQKTDSQAQYVLGHMHRFLYSNEWQDLRPHGRRAQALVPYQQRLTTLAQKAQSALVVKPVPAPWDIDQDEETAMVVRENVAYLTAEYDYSGVDTSSLGEWDYLLKHRAREGEPDMSLIVDADDEESITSSLEAEIEAEDAELERAKNGVLTPSRIIEVISEAETSYVKDWLDRLATKEIRVAWSAWREMKGSKRVRDVLIANALGRISHLQERLTKCKNGLLMEEWTAESSLRPMCEAMRVTVDDVELQQFKLSIWNRRAAPERPPQTGAHFHGKPHHHARGTVRMTNSPEDRLSASPPPPLTARERETSKESMPMPDAVSEENLFLTADEFNGFDASNEASPASDHLEELKAGPQTVLAEEDMVASSSNLVGSDSDPSIKQSPATSLEVYPEPPSAQCTPTKQRRVTQDPVIDLTLSSDSQKPSRKQRRLVRDRPVSGTFSNDPLNDSPSLIKTWELNKLIELQDRKRVLLKLLLDQGAQFCQMMRDTRRECPIAELATQIRASLRRMDQRQETVKSFNLGQHHYFDAFAHLWILWQLLPSDPRDLEELPWPRIHPKSNAYLDDFLMALSAVLNRLRNLFAEEDPAPVEEEQEQERQEEAIIPAGGDDDPTDQALIAISSEEEEEPEAVVHQTPHRKRKKHVKRNLNADAVQLAALRRKEKFKKYELATMANPTEVSNREDMPINPLRSDDSATIYIPKPAVSYMKAHQIDGVRFMWREITAEGEDGQGCILAHVMGLGKTMQTIALLSALEKATRSRNPMILEQLPSHLQELDLDQDGRQLRMLIVCPPTLIHNWKHEIYRWGTSKLRRQVLTVEAVQGRAQDEQIHDWHRSGGVLLIGYPLFRKKVGIPEPIDADAPTSDEQAAHELKSMLLDGAEVVVADEAQTIKSLKARISSSMHLFQTTSRIALTGTPMSNDVSEIFALISWVAPGYLGDQKHFNARYGEPIKEGTFADSTAHEVRTSIKKLAVLRRKIDPKVDRQDITVLRGSISSKLEFLITLPITELQRKIYQQYVNVLLGGRDRDEKISQVTIFSWLAVLTLLMNHPLAFKRKLLTPPKPVATKRKSITVEPASDRNTPSRTGADDDEEEITISDDLEDAVRTLGFASDTIKALTAKIPEDSSASLSPKMDVLLQILTASKDIGDKVLVFSSSIPTLDYVGELLHKHKIKYGRIDGAVPIAKREGIIQQLVKGKTKVMILSTRAAGVGLNLQCANRVVIIDFGFNPAHEAQAIGRAYRLGQTKPVFVYRLRCGGTFETNIYNKQMFKTSLASRVVDKKNPRRMAGRAEAREWLYDPKLVPQEDLSQWARKESEKDAGTRIQSQETFSQAHMREAQKDRVMALMIRRSEEEATEQGGLIRALSTMETLQQESTDAPLTLDEQLEVQQELAMMHGTVPNPSVNLNPYAPTAEQAIIQGTSVSGPASSHQQLQPAVASAQPKSSAQQHPHPHPTSTRRIPSSTVVKFPVPQDADVTDLTKRNGADSPDPIAPPVTEAVPSVHSNHMSPSTANGMLNGIARTDDGAKRSPSTQVRIAGLPAVDADEMPPSARSC